MLSTILACVSLMTAFGALTLGFKFYRNAPPWIDEKIENVLGTFLKPDEEGKNLVDHLADRFGKGFRMSLLAQRSGEVRHEKMIEGRVFEALKENSPELKIGLQALEQFGLGDLATPENLPALLAIAKKYGLFEMSGIFKGNPKSQAYGGKM